MLWEEGAFELKDPRQQVHPGVRRPARCGAAVRSNKPIARPDHRADGDVAPDDPHLRPHLRVHVRAPRRRAVPAGRLRVGRPPERPTSPASASSSPRCRCCSSPARSGTTRCRPTCSAGWSRWSPARPLDELLRERIFEPLGMVDTGFSVPGGPGRPARRALRRPSRHDAGDAARRGRAGGAAPAGGLPRRWRPRLAPRPTTCASPRCSATAASSTACACSSPRTVEYVTSNHLPGDADLTAFGRPLFGETTFDGVGFGLLGSVTIDPVTAKVPGSVGDFGWGGAASTTFWVDPVEDLTVRVHDPAAAVEHPPDPQPAEAARAPGPPRLIRTPST